MGGCCLHSLTDAQVTQKHTQISASSHRQLWAKSEGPTIFNTRGQRLHTRKPTHITGNLAKGRNISWDQSNSVSEAWYNLRNHARYKCGRTRKLLTSRWWRSKTTRMKLTANVPRHKYTTFRQCAERALRGYIKLSPMEWTHKACQVQFKYSYKCFACAPLHFVNNLSTNEAYVNIFLHNVRDHCVHKRADLFSFTSKFLWRATCQFEGFWRTQPAENSFLRSREGGGWAQTTKCATWQKSGALNNHESLVDPSIVSRTMNMTAGAGVILLTWTKLSTSGMWPSRAPTKNNLQNTSRRIQALCMVFGEKFSLFLCTTWKPATFTTTFSLFVLEGTAKLYAVLFFSNKTFTVEFDLPSKVGTKRVFLTQTPPVMNLWCHNSIKHSGQVQMQPPIKIVTANSTQWMFQELLASIKFPGTVIQCLWALTFSQFEWKFCLQSTKSGQSLSHAPDFVSAASIIVFFNWQSLRSLCTIRLSNLCYFWK